VELEILKHYCQQEEREQSDVLREFIRSLKKKIRADTARRSPASRFSSSR
jgi:protein-arginine kinase activator protein McsA